MMPSIELTPLASISDNRFQQLVQRAKVIERLVQNPNRSRWDVESAADELGVHRSTVYRDLRRVEGSDTISARSLAPSRPGYPRGRSRLHPHVDAIIDATFVDYHLKPSRPSLVKTKKVIDELCTKQGLAVPARSSIGRRLQKLNSTLVTGRRNGRKAKEAATARPGRFHVESPWDVWQIDHTLVDVIVLDSREMKPIGRPWLTVVIDVATRLVVGFYIGLEPPSILRAGVCMVQAVSDKSDWLRTRKIDYEWPAHGLPKLVHSDRASEFRSKAFIRALANQGVDTFFRPAGRAHWGGHVERLIGTLMGECRMLPGATHSSPKARGDYDSCKGARLTIEDLEMYFARQIVGIYNQSVHSALECSPLEAWKVKAAEILPRLPDDADHFRLDLLPQFEATITRTGIKKFGQEYASAETTVAFASGVRRVVVKFDPRDLSRLYVELQPKTYTAVPFRFPADPMRHPTLWFYKFHRIVAAKRNDHVEGLLAREAQRRTEEFLLSEAQSSKILRRAQERMRQDRFAAGQAALEDDSWGGAL